jgi:hypothetical protein
MTTTIFFDLDGTVYPLYQQENWLERITTGRDASVYAAEETLMDSVELLDTLCDLVDAGYSIGVISWLPNGIPAESPVVPCEADYAKAVRAAKREWVKKYLPMASEVHLVKYGTPKASTVKAGQPDAILVDDNTAIREGWGRGGAIDPRENLITKLRSLL